MLRTFLSIPIAVTPPLRRIYRELELLGGPLRLESQSQWHVTLKFLGATEDAVVPEIIAVGQSVAGKFPAFELELRGLGVFPHERHPVILWAGLFPPEPLKSLVRELEQVMVPLGFPAERREFHAHLTLARINGRSPRDFLPLLQKHATTEFGKAVVNHIELMKSDLRPQGAKHTSLATFPLTG